MIRHIRIVCLIFIAIWQGEGIGQDWRWRSRLDLAYVRDSNVFESFTEDQADDTGRLLLDVSGSGRVIHPIAVSFQYKGGIEGYRQYSDENRMIHDGKITCNAPLFRRLSAGLTVQGKTKTFFQTTRGYQISSISPVLRCSLPIGFRLSLIYSHAFLNYSQGTYFDTRYQNGGLLLEYTPFHELAVDIRWSMGTFTYDRNAFEYEFVDTAYQWMDRGEKQKDRFQEIAVYLEIYHWGLLRVGGSYQWNHSNSYGYSYDCPELHLMFAKELPWNMMLRFYGTLRWKRYRDELLPLLQIRPDAENEESSFLVADLCRDIFKDCSLRFRFGWYRNESPFRSYYYQKNLISFGLTQRF